MAKNKCYHCKELINDGDLELKDIGTGTIRKFHKENKCYKRYLVEKNKCKYCKEKILYDSDYEVFDNSYIHGDCIEPYIVRKKEQEDFDKVYKYIKNNLLHYPEHISFTEFQIRKLKGLRDGKSLLRKGEKQQYNGYSFHIIYLTLLYKSQDIKRILATKKFDREENKIDYIISVIANSVHGVYVKMKEKEEANKRLIKTVETMNKEKEVIKEDVEKIDDYKKRSTINHKILKALEEDENQLGI